MAKKKKASRKSKRPLTKLLCSKCKQIFYMTRKNPINSPDRLNMKKFCKVCKARTDFKETK
ncbi:MAG: 50S ribosomal protein L33 [Patescibacteria group bacterium]|nr:50S ribosomal protein L33 [Patescibacteria group bacterium]